MVERGYRGSAWEEEMTRRVAALVGTDTAWVRGVTKASDTVDMKATRPK